MSAWPAENPSASARTFSNPRTLERSGVTRTSACVCALVVGLAVALGAAPAAAFQSASLTEGNVVARLELEAPSTPDFILRGTIPVPRGTFPRADGTSPFAIRDIDGTLQPAQTEIVSRYSGDGFGDDGGADVVEVSARVTRPPDVAEGTHIDYDVVFLPHVLRGFEEDDSVADLLRAPGSILLTAKDVFGNRYAADLSLGDGSPKLLRSGDSIREWRTVGNLVPVGAHPWPADPEGTLPHLMGVQAYFRIYDRDAVVQIDLRIHNGQDGLDPTTDADDPVGRIYFQSLDLYVPSAWSVWEADPDAFTEPPEIIGDSTHYTLVSPLSGGKLHVLPIQAQTIRRLVLAHDEDETRAIEYVRDEMLGFARRGRNAAGEELFSWWNPDTARYFPQRHRLPELDHVPQATIEHDLHTRYAFAATALRNGTAPGYPILAPAFGWSHPWGVDDGGMAGGDEIVMYDGLRALEAASNDGYRLLAIRHRMLTDRHPVALFDASGEPTDYTEWTVHGSHGIWLPIWCFLTPILWAGDPFGFTSAPTFQVDAVHAAGLAPDYELSLSYYHPIDFEHFVRYTAPAKALVWLGNDSLAKDALLLNAQLFRLSYNDLPNSNYGDYISTGMGNDIHYVAAHPGIGFTFGRLEAWGLDCVAAAYSTAEPGWRARVRPWFQEAIDVVQAGQSTCSGIIQAMMYEQLFGGHYRARQSIEQAITENMLVGVRESVMRGFDPGRAAVIDDVLVHSLRAMVSWPCWSDVHHAPWNKMAVGDNDFTHAPFCGDQPADGFADGGDAYQCWSSFGYALELTGDDYFVQRASEMAGGPVLDVLLSEGLTNIENRAALLAFLQRAP